MDRLEFIVPVQRPVCMNSENLRFARDAISRLSREERDALLQEMLGALDHQVILGGGNFITAEVVIQIQSGEVNLSEVIRATAQRISKEKPADQEGN